MSESMQFEDLLALERGTEVNIKSAETDARVETGAVRDAIEGTLVLTVEGGRRGIDAGQFVSATRNTDGTVSVTVQVSTAQDIQRINRRRDTYGYTL